MQVLNMIVADLFQGHPISKRKLKELLGHTPSQVLGGALLGIVVACICCQTPLIRTWTISPLPVQFWSGCVVKSWTMFGLPWLTFSVNFVFNCFIVSLAWENSKTRSWKYICLIGKWFLDSCFLTHISGSFWFRYNRIIGRFKEYKFEQVLTWSSSKSLFMAFARVVVLIRLWVHIDTLAMFTRCCSYRSHHLWVFRVLGNYVYRALCRPRTFRGIKSFQTMVIG